MTLKALFGSALTLLIFASAPVYALQSVAADGSADHTTIQAGLDAAAVGEEVQVTDGGTYVEALNINGEVLTSVPAGATIDADGGNGAVIWGDVDATIDGFTIINAGNGIHIDGSPADVQILNCTINGGAGINFGAGAGVVNVTNCTITGGGHGILFNDGEGATCNITGSTITATGEHAVTLFRSATVTIADSFLNNCGQAGIRVDGSDTGVDRIVTVTNTQINNNGYCMGLMRKGVYSFTDCQINGNGADGPDSNWQGAFFIDTASAGSVLNLTNTSVSDNANHGLFAGRPVTLNMDGCTVSGNGGRGVFLDDYVGTTSDGVIATIANTTFQNNGFTGLTIAAKEVNATATVTDCTFRGNSVIAASFEANGSGSGKTILVDFQRNKIADGTSNSESVVGLNVAAAGSKVINNLFAQGATGLAVTNSSVDIYNNTFVGTADGNALDITETAGKAVNVMNNIFDGYDTGIISTDPVGLDNVAVDYNMIQSVTADYDDNINPLIGANNLTGQDPEFLLPSGTAGSGDYRLALTSPAIDAGTDLGITDDLKGNTRDAMPDLGAYEYESPVNIVITDWTIY